MNSTLAERLKLAMEGPPRVTGLALAVACNIKAPSVSDWLTGATKRMDSVNLIAAADFLRVNPKWLATGVGPREPIAAHYVSEPALNYTIDPWVAQAVKILNDLQPYQREGAVAALRTHVGYLAPPEAGQALSMAA